MEIVIRFYVRKDKQSRKPFVLVVEGLEKPLKNKLEAGAILVYEINQSVSVL